MKKLNFLTMYHILYISNKINIRKMFFRALIISILCLHISHDVQAFQMVTLPRKLEQSTSRILASSRSLSMVIKGPWRYSSDDWLQCLKTLPTSRILKRVKYNILFCTLWTALWTYFFKTASAKINFLKILSYPSSVHSIVGTALGLLLVFRTNASYDRFWEGRKLWSTIVVASRDIITHAYVHLNKSFHKKIANLLVSYSISLKQHIQGESNVAEFQPFLDEKSDLEKVVTQRNAPNILLRNLMVEIHEALKSSASDPVVAAMYEKDFSSSFHSLAASAASCERIVKQPVPLAYTRHTSRFLSLYLLTLPLTLIPALGWAAVPTMLAISWSFLSVQEIGLFIEDPFNKDFQIIPLNQIILVLRSDIAELLDGVTDWDCPEMERFDVKMIEPLKDKSRMQDDNYFAYY